MYQSSAVKEGGQCVSAFSLDGKIFMFVNDRLFGAVCFYDYSREDYSEEYK
jgi:hypothetical protein